MENHFEAKINHLFTRKRLEAASLKKQEEDVIEETQAQLKYLPFNVSTVLRQIKDETERRAKASKKSGAREYKDFNACENTDIYEGDAGNGN